MEKPVAFIKFIFKAIVNFNKHDGMVMAGPLAFLGFLAFFWAGYLENDNRI